MCGWNIDVVFKFNLLYSLFVNQLMELIMFKIITMLPSWVRSINLELVSSFHSAHHHEHPAH